MNKQNNCYLFTYSYPFDESEPFLETELPVLSTKFDNIYIFSIGSKNKRTNIRQLPDNAEAFALHCSQNKAKNVLIGIIANLRWRFKTKKNIKKKLADLYVIGRMTLVYKKVIHIIKSKNLTTTNSIFYSYWLNSSFVFMLFKHRFFFKSTIDTHFISRAHGFDLYEERNSLNYLPFQELYLNELDFICPISQNGLNYLYRKYPNFQKKVHLFRLGTNDYGFKNYNHNNQIIEIATCSSLYANKRVSLIAQALSKIQKKCNFIWHLIGDGEEYKTIMRIIDDNGMRDKVVLYGRVHNDEVINIYKNNNIKYFINVSKAEGVPVSIMEAISFGIPAIATDVGGTSEIVNSECGFLLPPDLTPDLLSRFFLKAFSTNGTKYDTLRKNARANWSRLSSALNNYSTWTGFLKSLLNSNS